MRPIIDQLNNARTEMSGWALRMIDHLDHSGDVTMTHSDGSDLVNADSMRTLQIDLDEPGPDLRLESSTQEIRRSLADLGLAVTVPTKPAPPGGRGVDLVEIGALIVSLKPTIELITEIVKLVGEWRGRDRGARVVRLTSGGRELVVEGASDDDIAKALELFDDDEDDE
ncbi:hypothetical protein [Actinoplanes sp. M2I2]|uniref:hypothetical protein n=1 Tax=Actinoplanes sp. M2I2 TaxID=1734444 RepID=UPI00202257DF|nr:hypothetical protein [Actinoplanes sp. M2I2]